MSKKNYYAVFGSNAVGVANNWDRVIKVEKYIKKFNNKRFDDFEEAEIFALEQANILIPKNFIPPISLECNNIIFLKDMIKMW